MRRLPGKGMPVARQGHAGRRKVWLVFYLIILGELLRLSRGGDAAGAEALVGEVVGPAFVSGEPLRDLANSPRGDPVA